MSKREEEGKGSGAKLVKADLPSFSDYIKKRLNEMLEENEATVSDFCKKADISAPSLYRYRQGACKKDSPKAKAILDLVSDSKAEYYSLLLHYFPDEAAIWREAYVKTGCEVARPQLLKFVQRDRAYYDLYSLAGLDYGLPHKTIEKFMGTQGSDRAQDLLDVGYLNLEEYRVTRDKHIVSYGCLDTVKKAAEFLVADFPLENIAKKEGGMSVIVDNLNEQGIKKAREAYLKFSKEMVQIFNSEENKGTVPMSCTVVTGKLKISDTYSSDVQELIKEGKITNVKKD